jgi:hypothetical protein
MVTAYLWHSVRLNTRDICGLVCFRTTLLDWQFVSAEIVSHYIVKESKAVGRKGKQE